MSIGRHTVEIANAQRVVLGAGTGNATNKTMHIAMTILSSHHHRCGA